ncbi:MAG TPA: hypothetical protein VGI90_09845 [Steroidobacteraceae bacterium]
MITIDPPIRFIPVSELAAVSAVRVIEFLAFSAAPNKNDPNKHIPLVLANPDRGEFEFFDPSQHDRVLSISDALIVRPQLDSLVHNINAVKEGKQQLFQSEDGALGVIVQLRQPSQQRFFNLQTGEICSLQSHFMSSFARWSIGYLSSESKFVPLFSI